MNLKSLVIINVILFSTCGLNAQVNWLKFEEAAAKAKENQKPIMIDVYTQWCGPCKLMSKNTFDDPKIAAYLNKNFYCVKFDAECFDTVRLEGVVNDTIRENGKVTGIEKKAHTFVFTNFGKPGTPKSPHQFAYSILDQKLQYPSVVFLSPELMRIDITIGYHTKEKFEPIIKYYGSGNYKTKTYKEFESSFKSEFE